MKTWTTLAIIGFSIAIIGCENNEVNPLVQSINIEPGKIEAKYIDGFGEHVEYDDQQIFISSSQAIYIFNYDQKQIELVDTLILENDIFNLNVKNSMMAVASYLPSGTGEVIIYKKSINGWQKSQVLNVGRSEDYFGVAIDFNENYLVVGASAPFIEGYVNSDRGRIYIYKNDNNKWKLDKEFMSEQSVPGDLFGEAVAIYNNFIFAGSSITPLHLYEYTDQWNIKKVDTILVRMIAHDADQFMLKHSVGYEPEIFYFTLSEDGEYNLNELYFSNSPGGTISSHGEIIDLENNFAIISNYYTLNVMKFESQEWHLQNVLDSQPGSQVDFYGLEVIPDKIMFGGMDMGNPGTAIVYIAETGN